MKNIEMPKPPCSSSGAQIGQVESGSDAVGGTGLTGAGRWAEGVG